jgi:ribosomal protein S18 acetylase RimI-like enzyme
MCRLAQAAPDAPVTLAAIVVVALRIVPYTPEHRPGAVALFAAEMWPSYTRDPARTCEALRAPGVTSLVAVEGDLVAGIVRLQSDGLIQAHLSTLVVAPNHRRRGVGRALLTEALLAAGGERMDLLSIADDFYASMTNRRLSGWRLTRADLGVQ